MPHALIVGRRDSAGKRTKEYGNFLKRTGLIDVQKEGDGNKMPRPLIPPHKIHKSHIDYSRKNAKAVPWGEVVETLERQTKVVKGNLVEMANDGQFDAIIHGCNCFCKMGAGIAKEIARTFPQAEAIDKTTVPGDKSKLGSYTSVGVRNKHGGNLIVVNLYTQYFYGRKYGVPFSYEAFRKGLRKLAPNAGQLRIGLPKIGAGLAGGDWTRIQQILGEEFAHVDYTVVEYHKSGLW
jgi:O-acetyl-ADP-ribose deacetylase (regulator of RNase III)